MDNKHAYRTGIFILYFCYKCKFWSVLYEIFVKYPFSINIIPVRVKELKNNYDKCTEGHEMFLKLLPLDAIALILETRSFA